MGYQALFENIAGSNNTVMGYRAGYGNNGNGNVFIGHYAGRNESGNNKLYISNSDTSNPLIKGDFTSEVVEINTVMKLTPRATAPASPVAGMMYIDSTNSNKLMVYDGTSWHACW